MDAIKAFFEAQPMWVRVVLLLALAWPAAAVVRLGVRVLLKAFRFDRFCMKTGISEFLRKGEVAFSPAQLVGYIAYWSILVAFAMNAARLMDVRAVQAFQLRIVEGLPLLLIGVAHLAVGLVIVGFVSGLVRTVARNAGSLYAELWFRCTRWMGTILVIAIAGEQFAVRGTIFSLVLVILLSALAFGCALAFGLGCKDMARAAMERFVASIRERHAAPPGQDMEG